MKKSPAFVPMANLLVAASMTVLGAGPLAAQELGLPTLASVNDMGTGTGDGRSINPSISADGRFVAFRSDATDLVATPDTNDFSDLFVRDLVAGVTTLVTHNFLGTDTGNNPSGNGVISADGNLVAFLSGASDLVENDNNNNTDIFVRDLQAGTTTLVSANNTGTDSGDGASGSRPSISADGRFVVFASLATDLVANDTNNNTDIFVRDLQAGTTTLVSANNTGTDSGDGGSLGRTSISADGRFVVFYGRATDLVANDNNGTRDVFVRDLQAGTTTLVSINNTGTDSGDSHSTRPSISADGRFVVFHSRATDLVANDNNGTRDFFVRDLQAGTTTLVSINNTGTDSGNGRSHYGVISADGGAVAFESYATDLTELLDPNGGSDVFVALSSGKIAEYTETLIADIQALGLPNKVAKAILAPMKNISQLLEDGNPNNDMSVCGKLDEMIMTVNEKEAAGLMSADDAAAIRNAGQAIQAGLGC